jgi:hypothetical protein
VKLDGCIPVSGSPSESSLKPLFAIGIFSSCSCTHEQCRSQS